MWLYKNKKKALVVLFFYWLIVNLLVLHNPFLYFDHIAVPAIEQVQVLHDGGESPKYLNKIGWQNVELPDVWFSTKKNKNQYWYRSHFYPDREIEGIWSVYLPSVTHNAAVYINGIWIGQAGEFTDPVSRHHNEPLFFSFSSELLKSGINELHVRVKASYHEQGLLGNVYLARQALLLPAYKFKHFIRVDLIKWLTTGMYLMALVVLGFWVARRQDVIYGLFSLELFFWATHNLNLVVTDIPLTARLWEALAMTTLGWTVLTMIFFNHRFVGEKHSRIEKWVLLCSVLGIGILLLPDVETILHIGYRIWDTMLIVTGLYLIGYLIRVFWRDPQSDYYLMIVVGIPMLIFGLHDILVVNHLMDATDGLIIQFSVIPAVMLFSWFIVRRFVGSINQAEHLAEHLELRVEEKRQALLVQYEKLKELEKQTVLGEERERIMRDMHDGIGGQLVSVISLLQEHQGDIFKRLREKVQHSLTDLRFVIDSLDPVQNDLPVLLGTMRMRLHDQLDAANIYLEWAVTELPEISVMTPSRSLHIMRIVQEAITNCIKHADCKKMTLATGTVGQDKIFIDIIDYGKGMDVEHMSKQEQGRGILNMYHRANEIGASLHLNSSPEGTQIRIEFATV